MSFLEKIKKLCEENNISQRKVESDLELSNGSISKWSKSSPSGDVVQKLADYFGISTDYLLGNSEFRNEEEMFAHWDEKHNPDGKLAEEVRGLERLNEKDERDIAKDMSYLLEQFDSQEALMFDGEVLDEETKQLLLQSLEHSMRIGKAMAKQKYTPKKYRK